MKFELNYEVDLSKPVLTQALNQPLFYSDSTAHELRITLKDDTFPEEASGYAYFVHLNNNVTERQELEFSEDRSVCYVTIPAIAYNTIGPISIVVQIAEAGEKTTILALAAEVKPAKSGTVIDCSGIVLPDIDDILDRLEQAEQGVADITATVRTNVRQDNSADFLYKAFFGDDSDFSVTQNGTAKLSKEGRTFDFTRTGVHGSTFYWTNLTGTTHGVFTGNVSAASSTIKGRYTDFVDIPYWVRRDIVNDSREGHSIKFVIKHFTTVSYLAFTSKEDTYGANQHSLMIVFRRFDPETEDYVYSSIFELSTLYSCSKHGVEGAETLDHTPDPPIFVVGNAFTVNREIDETTYSHIWNDYDQFAVYLYRSTQSSAVNVVLEPAIIVD